jgi:hypothetical protein
VRLPVVATANRLITLERGDVPAFNSAPAPPLNASDACRSCTGRSPGAGDGQGVRAPLHLRQVDGTLRQGWEGGRKRVASREAGTVSMVIMMIFAST